MTDDTIDYCREIMINHVLIIIVCLFLVVYVVINYNLINEGNIYAGNLPKTFIITGVIFLILYIFLIWDDGEDLAVHKEVEEDLIFMPKYKIVNKINIKENTTDKIQALNTKPQQEFKIENKYNTKYIKENSSNKQENSNNKQENSNIFISNKNKSKFGIKF